MEKHQEAVNLAEIHLAIEEKLKFYQTGSNASFFTKHSQLILPRKFFRWKLEKSYTRKFTCHLGLRQRSHWSTNGRENWVQNMLNNQKSDSYLEVSNRTKKIISEFARKRWNPLSRMTWLQCKMNLKRPVFKRSMFNFFHEELDSSKKRGTRQWEVR